MVTPVETLTGMIPTVVAARLVQRAATAGTRRRAQRAAPVKRRKATRAKPKRARATKRKTVRRGR